MSVFHFMRPGLVALAVLSIARPAPQPEPPRVDPPTPTSPSAEGPLVTALTVSWSHACAAERDGGLRCWGIDGVMMAGLAEIDEVDLARTIDVPPVRTAVATALADCVALRSGAVRCWGSRDGQNFNGVVEGLEDIVSLAGGSWVRAGDGHLDVRCFEPGSPTPPILRARAAGRCVIIPGFA